MRTIDGKRVGAVVVLAAALLWALSIPFSKLLLAEVPPLTLAGLFYLGAGLGLAGYRAASRRSREAALRTRDMGWVLAIALAGGVGAPSLQLLGLRSTPASVVSLLACTEGVFTVLLASLLFREAVGSRILVASVLMVVGAMVLAFEPASPLRGGLVSIAPGALLVIGSCLLWGLDNNLTRHLSDKDPVAITSFKGLIAGAGVIGVSLAARVPMPRPSIVAAALLLGLVSNGASVVLFTRGLRLLGAARTAALFGIAPFLASLISLPIAGEAPALRLLVAGALMGVGTVLILREEHGHDHGHACLEHEHPHTHDSHHQHAHDDPLPPEPHCHLHRHDPLVHAHAHVPDLHHRHAH